MNHLRDMGYDIGITSAGMLVVGACLAEEANKTIDQVMEENVKEQGGKSFTN